MKLICSLHLKKKTVEISSPKYVQVGAKLHHFNCRFYKNSGGAGARTPLVFRNFYFLSLGPLFSRNRDKTLRRQSAADYMAGYLKTVMHTILSRCAVYLYLFMYRCGCIYWVTHRVFIWGTPQQQQKRLTRGKSMPACVHAVFILFEASLIPVGYQGQKLRIPRDVSSSYYSFGCCACLQRFYTYLVSAFSAHSTSFSPNLQRWNVF